MIFSTYNAVITGAFTSVALAVNSAAVFVYVATQPPPIEGFASYRQDVSPGDVVDIAWQIKKRVDCMGVSMRVWEGEGGFSLREPTRPVTIPSTPDWRVFNVQTEIPDQASDGWLTLSIEGVYDCPNRRIPFSLGPVVFEVTAGGVIHETH